MSDWIHVEGRLPAAGVCVLVTDGAAYDIALYEPGLNDEMPWRHQVYAGALDLVVTHWMPLPEPPEVQRDVKSDTWGGYPISSGPELTEAEAAFVDGPEVYELVEVRPGIGQVWRRIKSGESLHRSALCPCPVPCSCPCHVGGA